MAYNQQFPGAPMHNICQENESLKLELEVCKQYIAKLSNEFSRQSGGTQIGNQQMEAKLNNYYNEIQRLNNKLGNEASNRRLWESNVKELEKEKQKNYILSVELERLNRENKEKEDQAVQLTNENIDLFNDKQRLHEEKLKIEKERDNQNDLLMQVMEQNQELEGKLRTQQEVYNAPSIAGSSYSVYSNNNNFR